MARPPWKSAAAQPRRTGKCRCSMCGTAGISRRSSARTRASSSRRSNGLARKSSAPRSSPRTRSSRLSRAVRTSTGVVDLRARSLRQHLQPTQCRQADVQNHQVVGTPMASAWSALSPLSTMSTAWADCTSARDRASASTVSSSTTRVRIDSASSLGTHRSVRPRVAIRSAREADALLTGSRRFSMSACGPDPGIRERQLTPGGRTRTAGFKQSDLKREDPQSTDCRGRNIHCWTPPTQIPACAIHAPGSHLG